MTNHRRENIHPLIGRRLVSARRRKRVAPAAPIRQRLRREDVRLIIGFAVVAAAASILILVLSAVALRSGRAVIGDLIPGWPWW